MKNSRWDKSLFTVVLLAVISLIYVIPALKSRWFVDDYYFFPFLEKSMLPAFKDWFGIWGFERLQYFFLSRILYPLGEGSAQLVLVALHALCSVTLIGAMRKLGWPTGMALAAGLFFAILPFQFEPVLWVCVFGHISHLLILSAVICFAIGCNRAAPRQYFWWGMAFLCAFISCFGYGAYMFAPMLMIPTLLAPKIWEKGRPLRVFLGALVLAFVPLTLYAGLLLIKRYELRGDINLFRIPRVALSTQWYALVELYRSYAALFRQSHFDSSQIGFLAAGLLCSGILAWILLRYRRQEAAPGKRYFFWAYGCLLVGYSVYWLRGGSPGVPRMHYFASIGIAAIAAGLLYILPIRKSVFRWLSTIGLSAVILVNVWSAHTRALAFANSTENVKKKAERFKPVAANAFSVLYCQCGAVCWFKDIGIKNERPIYDVYYVRQWIQTGYQEFWPPDSREDEIRMAELLKQTYQWLWPQLSGKDRLVLAHKAAETIRPLALKLGFEKVALQAASIADTCNVDINSLCALADLLFQALLEARRSGNLADIPWMSSVPSSTQILELSDPRPCLRD